MNHNFKRYYFLTVEIKNIIILWLMQGIFFDQPVKMIEEHMIIFEKLKLVNVMIT